jgi:hypothetical protein
MAETQRSRRDSIKDYLRFMKTGSVKKFTDIQEVSMKFQDFHNNSILKDSTISDNSIGGMP